MIHSPARMTAPLVRQAWRSSRPAVSPSRLLLRAGHRRLASGTAQATKEAAKSDAPWAISSLVIFGGMFVYLTSPPKGGKKAHGHHEEHGRDDEADSDTSDSGGTETPDTDADEREYIVDKKIEDRPHPESDAPAGSHHLAKNSLTAEEGAHKQKTTKTAGDLHKPDNITFQKGVSASKEGHSGKENSHMSDPKKVVAAAHAERDDRKGKAKDAKDAKDAKGAQDAKAADGELDSDDVHGSVEAADANAQNEKSDQDIQESQDVHDSDNAKEANANNEEAGGDKEDE